MSWMLTSSRPLHWFRLLLGPRPKIPPWINMPPGVWKPLSTTIGEERAGLLAADPHLRRLDQRPAGGELGAVGQRDRHQVVERPARVDQGDLRVVVLQRLDHRAGVEPQHLRQVGALDPPLLPRRDGLLLEVGEHVPGPVDLERRDQVAAQGGDPLDQVAAPLDGVEGAGVHAPVLVHQEVGVGGLEQGVVLRGLDVPVPGVQDLPGHQGLVDGVGRGDEPPQAGTAVEEVGARARS